jgi:hypothetical protein
MTSVKLLPLLLALGPAALAAQEGTDSRWLPWLGCWQVGAVAEPDHPMVCVRPASDPLGVEIAAVAGAEIVISRTLIADGQPHPLTLENCAGSQVASFSADGRRVFLRSSLTCQGGRRRTASAVMAMASPTVWLDAQSLGMNDEGVSRVLHYYPAPEVSWPNEFRFPTERADAVADARVLAADRLSLLDVREAAAHVDPEALATFLLERNQRFDLTAAALAALDEAAVPDAVIDALVAVSFPERFAVDRGDTRLALRSGTPRAPRDQAYADPYGWGWWDYGWCGRSAYCDSYLYPASDLGFPGYRPFGYDPSFFGGFLGTPIIVVRGRGTGPHGAAVSGRGYTRGGQPAGTGDGRSARPRGEATSRGTGDPGVSTSATQAGSSSGAGSASSGGYSRGGGSSSSSGSSSGTAKSKGRT